jgi:transcriptional regulator with GAF, ATPase, and Fis domain
LKSIETVAPTDASVLILGETGTGKELIARAIHNLSRRKTRALIKVNCAAIPSGLVESELFGHEKGAFTGALTQKIGRFELANKGTIFLDEIAELPLDLQPKLLRVLQEGEFERVGGTRTIKVDVRIIAATNRNLDVAVQEGRFREDLFYRLNVFPVTLPPLRERQDDIAPLARYFAIKYGKRLGKKIEQMPRKVLDALKAHPWPGNIRELENVIERAIITSQGPQLELGDALPQRSVRSQGKELLTLEEMERNHITEVLKSTGWQVSGGGGAAELLGMKPTTLDSRIKKLGIKKRANISGIS